MEYQLIKVIPITLPCYRIIDGVSVFGIPIIIYTGIVSQSYAGFENADETFCPIELTDGTTAIEEKMNLFGAVFVLTKYPNT